jgi:hypothetical protein
MKFLSYVCMYLVQMWTNFCCSQLNSLCLAKFLRNYSREGSISMTHTVVEAPSSIFIVRYHSGGSMKLNACILFLTHMVYL